MSSGNSHPFYILDVFAESVYAGNQLAVVGRADDLSDFQMQQIARETNFSETTFIESNEPSDGGYNVRIFTPTAEIPFAGHPTLGTAHVIRHELGVNQSEIRLNLKVGTIPVTFASAGTGGELAWLHQSTPEFGPTHPTAPLAELLGLKSSDIDERYRIEEVSMGVPFTTIPIRTLDALSRASYSVDRLAKLDYQDFSKALFLVCPETRSTQNDFCVRMFAPRLGVPEDPATGSANACLAGYLLKHKYFGDSPVDVRVEQGFEIDRPSLLHVKGECNGDEMQISVGGNVMLTVRGELVS